MNQDWPSESRELRLEVIEHTLRVATMEELKSLGEERFEVVSDPWFERYNQWLKKNKSHRFYRADTPECAVVVYCADVNEGVWFLPGMAMGVIQPEGLNALAEIVERHG